jgi:biotin carboxyl carrier protein
VKVVLRVGERVRRARVLRRGDTLHVAFEDGGEETVRLLAAGRDAGTAAAAAFELERGQRRIHGAGVVLGDERQLWVNGRLIRYRRELAHGRGGRGPAEDLGLSSSIPAVVTEVLVETGEHVEAGQKLVLLESMKMVIPIQASRAGTVRAILCSPGDAVEPGVPLIEIEASEG